MSSTGNDRIGARPRQGLRSLAVLVAIAVIWETAKILLALPSYQLPHLHEIALYDAWDGGTIWKVLSKNCARANHK